MPDYITDALYAVLSAQPPRKAPKYRASPFPRLMGDIRSHVGRLEDRELYAFSRSALNAAADLRIDTPDRVDRLALAVLSTERRLFIEADASDIASINDNLRGLLAPMSSPPPAKTRWGAFIDIEGNGKARFELVAMQPRETLRKDPAMAELLRLSRGIEGRLGPSAQAALALDFPHWRADIDISRHIGMSRGEFEKALSRISTSHDPVARFGIEEAARASGVRERDRIISDTWRALRFRDILRVLPRDENVSPGPQEKLEALRAGLPIIAMLAVLAAEGGDISSAPRKRAERKSSAGAGPGAGPASDLRIVTLNLEDRDLQRIYDGQDAGSSGQAKSPADHGRVRHPVRGHLFLARNGKMTWRKPHWRGSLERPLLHRVVAPSHR